VKDVLVIGIYLVLLVLVFFAVYQAFRAMEEVLREWRAKRRTSPRPHDAPHDDHETAQREMWEAVGYDAWKTTWEQEQSR